MPSTCAICQETFTQWFLYRMYLESHKVAVKDYGIKRPYTKEERIAIVARGEARIGSHHFIGGK